MRTATAKMIPSALSRPSLATNSGEKDRHSYEHEY